MIPLRRLGKEGPEVFPLGLGGMPMSITGRPEEAQSVETILAALEAGMTLIDTADVYCLDQDDYGHNERLVAKALRRWKGSRPVVATKGGLRRPLGAWTRDASPSALRSACEASLKALGVACIDLYQLHAPDEKVPFADTVGMLETLRKEGKVLRIGLSNVTAAQILQAQGITRIATVQNRFSPFFREVLQNGVLETCAREGIGFLAYSPVGGGRLHRKLAAHPAASAVAGRLGATPHNVVLAWVLAQSPAVIPIPGASRPANARSSVQAASLRLSAADMAEITEAAFPTD